MARPVMAGTRPGALLGRGSPQEPSAFWFKRSHSNPRITAFSAASLILLLFMAEAFPAPTRPFIAPGNPAAPTPRTPAADAILTSVFTLIFGAATVGATLKVLVALLVEM